jgi:glycosyltransferase involved in cell wall biosynthesis
MNRVALVVPCYNEEKRLDVRAFTDARLPDARLELVLVDDGSRDGTRSILERLREARPDVHVVALEQNGGKAEAVRHGVLDALTRSPDAVGFWDADLATPLSELPDFVAALDSDPQVDIVLGSRVKLMGRTIERRVMRHYLGRLFATAASVVLRLPVYDTQCGAKLFRATPLLARVFEEPFLARWVFDVELIARFLAYDPLGREHSAARLVELPLRQWIDVRGSKLKSIDFARAALDLAIIQRVYVTGNPSRTRSIDGPTTPDGTSRVVD